MSYVLVAYVDESYNKNFYYIAAYVIDESEIPRLLEAHKRVLEYAKAFGVGEDTELHAHSMMSGTDGWEPIKGKARAAIAIYQRALDELVTVPSKMIVRGLDVSRLNARYRYPHPPHQVVLQHLLETLNEHAQSRGQRVRIVADHIANEQAHHDKAENYKVEGTPGYKPSRLKRIDLPIEFEDSHEFPGLQAADLIAYIYRRFDGHEGGSDKSVAATAKLWETLKPIWGHVWKWEP